MKGYWDDPQKTAETIDENGWLKTGDIGNTEYYLIIAFIRFIQGLFKKKFKSVYDFKCFKSEYLRHCFYWSSFCQNLV